MTVRAIRLRAETGRSFHVAGTASSVWTLPVALLDEGAKAVFGRVLKKCQKANELRKKYGLLAPVQDAATLLGEKLCDFEATTIVWLEPESLSIDLDLPGDTEMRFLTAAEVETFAAQPELQIKSSLVARAHAGSDLCYAGFVDGQLASYGWYSLAPEVPADDFGLVMAGPATSAYMHNGFTHPDFRGRRLHGIGMGRALQALGDRGVTALLSDVDWGNHASLRSCWRLGYQNLGNLYTFGRGRCRFAIRPKAALQRGISFVRKMPETLSESHSQLALS